MKKHLLYAALFVAALSSCSKDNDRVSAPKAENEDLQAIELGVSSGNNFTAVTRGLGMVGVADLEDTGIMTEENNWRGQSLWVLMRHMGKIDSIAKADLDYSWAGMAETYTVLNNYKLIAPSTGETGLITSNPAVQAPYFYYPVTGNFDFYGYHVDDAATMLNDAPAVATSEDKTYQYVSFQIDGTQDLMAAKADFISDAAGNENANELVAADGQKSYSAYAARRGVQPTLKFNHLLTKLNFIVINMNKPDVYTEDQVGQSGDRDGNTIVPAKTPLISVTGIEVRKTATKGRLTVAAAQGATESAGKITWTSYNAGTPAGEGGTPAATPGDDPLTVKNNTDTDSNGKLDDLVEKELTNYNVDYPIGAGLLLQPAKDTQYEGTIYFKQQLPTNYENGDYKEETVEQEVDFVIKAENIESAVEGVNGFEAGYAYNVYIKVWGIQQIEITAALTAWEDGGDVNMTPEDEAFDPYDPEIAKKKEIALMEIATTPASTADFDELFAWADKYYVSGEDLETARPLYNIDGNDVVDVADKAAFALDAVMDKEVTSFTRVINSEVASIEGYKALLDYFDGEIDGATYKWNGEWVTDTYGAVYGNNTGDAQTPVYVLNDIIAREKLAELEKAEDRATDWDVVKEAVGEADATATIAGCDALIDFMKEYGVLTEEELDYVGGYITSNDGAIAAVKAVKAGLTAAEEDAKEIAKQEAIAAITGDVSANNYDKILALAEHGVTPAEMATLFPDYDMAIAPAEGEGEAVKDGQITEADKTAWVEANTPADSEE